MAGSGCVTKTYAILAALTLGLSSNIGLGVSAAPVPLKVFEKPNASAQTTTAESKTTTQSDVSKIVINIPSRALWVYSGNNIIRYFPVGVGKPGFMTPLGKYTVIHKIIDPGWEHPYLPKGKMRIAPGSDNPLGTRWIGFYEYKGGEFGMHGTDRPSSVGQFSSHGCIRMRMRDVEALFEMVDQGTPVEVVYETVLIRPKNNEIRIIAYPDAFKRGMPSADKVVSDIQHDYPHAKVELEKIKAALAHPTQQPVTVGFVEPPLLPFEAPVPKPIAAEPASSSLEKQAPPPHLEPILKPAN